MSRLNNKLYSNFQMSIMQINASDIRILHNKSDPNPESTHAQQDLCQICFSTKLLSRKFAQCDHTKLCLKCARENTLNNLKQGKYPVCLNQNCKQPMIKRSKSLYDYFDDGLKQQIETFQSSIRKSAERGQIPCKYPNCVGIQEKFRCKKCLKLHCEICQEIQHSSLSKCKGPEIIQGLNQCPNCKEGYIKDYGCNHITCFKCKFQFCNVCFKAWSKLHHTCLDKSNKFTNSSGGDTSTLDQTKFFKKPRGSKMGCCGLSESCQLF